MDKGTGNRIRRCSAVFIFLFVVLIFCRSQKIDTDPALQQMQDSLEDVLAKAVHANEKIRVLELLANLNEQKTEELVYRKQVIEVANQADTLDCSFHSMTLIVSYYAIKKDIDSMKLWVNKLDSIGRIDTVAIGYQFQAYNYLCRVYMANSELEQAMNIAISQRLLADKTGNIAGHILSSENLGLIYMLTSRYKEASSLLETCLSFLKKEEGRLSFKLQVAESLIRTYIYQSEFEKAEKLLAYYDETLKQIEMDNSGNYLNYDIGYSRVFFYSYRIWMYSLQGEHTKAHEAVKALKSYEDSLYGFCKIINMFAMANYYFSTKEYDKALSTLQPIEEGDEEVLRLKVRILKEKGNKVQVLETNKQLLDVYKVKNVAAYMKQVDQLRSLQSINEEEKQIRILLHQKQELENKHTQLILMFFFSLILAIALILLIRYSLNMHRLKNALIREKNILKETNHHLEIAKEKAEKADRMKTNFIANISHEICTPLNVIVGYTSLLPNSAGEERAGYIKAINENSDFLLNLVSDVLNLSHLDEARFTLSFQIEPVQDCSEDTTGQSSSSASEK